MAGGLNIGALGSLLSGGGSILGGILGANASKNAGQIIYGAGQQAAGGVNAATQNGQNLIGGQYNNLGNLYGNLFSGLGGMYGGLNSNLSPYIQAGQQGVSNFMGAIAPGGALSSTFSFNPQTVAQNPGYQFNLQQGTQAIQRGAAAQGGLLGGGTQRQLAEFASGLANNTEQNLYNQGLTTFQTNRANTLQNYGTELGLGQFGVGAANSLGIAQGGQALGATNTLGQLGNQLQLGSANLGLQGSGLAGNFGVQGAQGLAAGTVGAANSYNSILPGIVNALYGYGLYNSLGSGGGGYGSYGGGYGGGYGGYNYPTGTGTTPPFTTPGITSGNP